MKLCSLILAHQNTQVVRRLTERLLANGIDCYVHIDASQDLAEFRAALPSEVKFVEDRVRVYWAGFSMIEAVIRLSEMALADSDCTHFLHISGDTYPIKPMHQLKEMLTQDVDWIDVGEISPNPDDSTFARISRVYLPDYPISELSQRHWQGFRYVTPEFFNVLPNVMRMYQLKETKRFPLRYAKGGNWWNLRRDTLESCLKLYKTRPDIVDWFRFSAHPDESFLNSLVLNFIGGETRECPIFTLWDRQPQPYQFGLTSDFDLLLNTPKPLGRKFTEWSGELLDLLDASMT